MALSFTTAHACDDRFPRKRRVVLVTGAAGAIGRVFVRAAADHHDLRLMVRTGTDAKDLSTYGAVVACDLADLDGLHDACRGIDTVLHLAGTPDPSATWSQVLADNIIGAYNLFAAAKAAGCRRVVYASSIHAVSGYPIDVQVKASDPVNPGDLYGVSKCFGEALGRYLAEQEDLSVIAVRIGACLPASSVVEPDAVGVLDTWIAEDDLVELLLRAIDDDSLRWAMLHAVSDNRFKRLDISTARDLLGFSPTGDAFRQRPEVAAAGIARQILGHNARDERQRSGLREELERLRGRNPA
jgi:NAD(P)-dependent dehydrogenase (short-subunit alcohol dehydrogenase family)